MKTSLPRVTLISLRLPPSQRFHGLEGASPSRQFTSFAKAALCGLMLFLAVVGIDNASGRKVRLWSYEELLNASDLVAIIEPLSTTDAKDAYPGPAYGHVLSDFSGHDTTFKVHAILKGNFPVGKELTVLHFSYSKDVVAVVNGACFAHFIPGPLEFKKQVLKDRKEVGGTTVYAEDPIWLAFLKKRDDGRYEPVTDPYDSADSFRELHRASFFIP